MNIYVYAARVNPRIDRPLCRKPRSHVQNLLDTNAAFQVDMFDLKAGVQLRPTAPHPLELENAVISQAVQTLGGSNLVPFSRGAQGKIGKPDSINYPIPACGAHNRPLWCSDVNFVPLLEAGAF